MGTQPQGPPSAWPAPRAHSVCNSTACTKDLQRLQLHGPHLVAGAWPSEEGRCTDEVTQVHTNAGKGTKPASDISGVQCQNGLLPFHDGATQLVFSTKFLFHSALNPIPYKTYKALCFTPVCFDSRHPDRCPPVPNTGRGAEPIQR